MSENTNKIWLTSDTHFNHGNIIEYEQRPFEDLEAMTKFIIARWNQLIKPGDTVFHLGDFALTYGTKHAKLVDDILADLNGQKWLVTGNHDRPEVTGNRRWVSVKPYHEIKVDMGGEHKQRIVLCHYPMRSWNQMQRGAWMLHGHCHGNLRDIGGKIMDVGVDANDLMPVSLEEVFTFMAPRPITVEDHHTPTTT